MMDKLMKLMEKKKAEGKELDPMKAKAKMDMLEALHKEMSDMMASDLHGDHKMAKAEVMAPDKEGLKMGLEKAKEALDKGPMEEDKEEDEESPEHEAAESPEEEKSEHGVEDADHMDDEKALMDAYHEEPSKENLDKLMAHLSAKQMRME